MEFEAFAIHEEQGSVVDIVVSAHSLLAVVLEVGLETLKLSWHDLNDLVGGKPVQLKSIKAFRERVDGSIVDEIDKRVSKIRVRFVIHRKVEEIKFVIETCLSDFRQ